MTPSWYDVLDVDETATPAEIRTAWKAAIADLDPGDRRFRLANQAAEVLLDPVKRAAHDETLEAERAQGDERDEPVEAVEPVEPAGPAAAVVTDDADEDEGEGSDPAADDEDDDQDDDVAPVAARTRTPATTRKTKPAATGATPAATSTATTTSGGGSRLAALPRALLALAVVALVLVVLTVVALVQGRDTSGAAEDGGLPSTQQVEDARGAAEAAVVPVLAYDYRSLDEDQAEARTYLTDDYAKEYDRFFAAAVETNAPRTKTVVRVRVLDSAIVRTGEDRVDVLLFVNRPTTNAQRSVEYRDQVTMRMLDVDGTWLVDCMITTGTGPCEGD